MSVPDLPPPTLVEDASGMANLIADLEGQKAIAVDTEADSFFSYREKVCLVQVTVEDRDYIVDPLAQGVDIGLLGPIFADPSSTKIFHDSEYDVLILKRDFDFTFSSLFDTRVGAATLGSSAPGLASVLAEEFGVELDKSEQRSNWARRPLTPNQVRYARLDTHYLLPLMERQAARLRECGRLMIVESECRRMEQLVPTIVIFNPDEWVRIKGARELKPRQRAVLRELFILRDELASKANDPPFRVMNNQVMLELSRNEPSTPRQLSRVHGFSPRMSRRMGPLVLDAISRGTEGAGIDKFPSLPRRDGTGSMSELEHDLYDRLRRWRKGVADELGIESSYLLNRHVMARIAGEQPTDRAALIEVEGVLEWQIDLFGDSLLAVIQEFASLVKKGQLPRKRPWRR